MVTLTLPYPPLSGNNQYGRRRALSKKGRWYSKPFTLKAVTEWRSEVRLRALTVMPRRVEGPVQVQLDLWPPDLKRRDQDDAEKVIFDALVRADVIEDDSLIIRHTTTWHPVVAGGTVVASVERWREDA